MGEAASPQELPEALPPMPALELAVAFGGVGWQPPFGEDLALLADAAATPQLVLQAPQRGPPPGEAGQKSMWKVEIRRVVDRSWSVPRAPMRCFHVTKD